MAEIIIKPEREYLHEIVSKIKKGIYGVPSFQRSFVWKKEQVLDLFDSIQHGYPIGSILLWKPDSSQFPLQSRNIISDEIDEESNPDYYILDGRQRLTSFYCSVLNASNKKDEFNISYNLERECFEYVKRPQLYILPVSEIYDTFIMLEKMQQIVEYYKTDTFKAQTYVSRARKMNSILQSYQIGEILLENCDINEASTVFSRLNSKGTDISKVSMLQAVFYKTKNDLLVADSINEFITSLSVYGFNSLKSDDILNCCYRYVGKNFYDSQLFKDLEKLDFTDHWPEIKSDIYNTIQFLHDDCNVISSKLLPYVKQLIALTWFFKEHKKPTIEQKKELKKWFFYTSYNQSFLNGSLTIVRTLFRRFEKFVFGESNTAIDYEEVKIGLDSLKFRYTSGSALSNLMIISIVAKYLSLNPEEQVVYCDPIKFNGDDPRGVVPYFNTDDRSKVIAMPLNDLQFQSSYAISPEMVMALRNKDIKKFCELRGEMILTLEKELLASVGLSYSLDNP